MPLEIERKFLVKGDFRKDMVSVANVRQGYLCAEPGRSIRVRLYDQQGFLTIKGATDPTGISRYEFEKEISKEEAVELMELCLPGRIEKERFNIDYAGKRWEVDVFYGENEGLVMAEIELNAPDEPFELPEWIGKEVTGDKRYYNSSLSKHPYKSWDQ